MANVDNAANEPSKAARRLLIFLHIVLIALAAAFLYALYLGDKARAAEAVKDGSITFLPPNLNLLLILGLLGVLVVLSSVWSYVMYATYFPKVAATFEYKIARLAGGPLIGSLAVPALVLCFVLAANYFLAETINYKKFESQIVGFRQDLKKARDDVAMARSFAGTSFRDFVLMMHRDAEITIQCASDVIAAPVFPTGVQAYVQHKSVTPGGLKEFPIQVASDKNELSMEIKSRTVSYFKFLAGYVKHDTTNDRVFLKIDVQINPDFVSQLCGTPSNAQQNAASAAQQNNQNIHRNDPKSLKSNVELPTIAY